MSLKKTVIKFSPNYPEFSNRTEPPKTSNTSKERKLTRKSKGSEGKRKRLSALDVLQIIQSRKISTRPEIVALAELAS